jgi:hypothetical protein
MEIGGAEGHIKLFFERQGIKVLLAVLSIQRKDQLRRRYNSAAKLLAAKYFYSGNSSRQKGVAR